VDVEVSEGAGVGAEVFVLVAVGEAVSVGDWMVAEGVGVAEGLTVFEMVGGTRVKLAVIVGVWLGVGVMVGTFGT
jgi:hypothetical protein